MTIVQVYQSELKDLCRYWLEPWRTIEIQTKVCKDPIRRSNKLPMTFATGAKQIDIGEYMVAKDITGLLKVINRALANRKTRDNVTNDVSSRSICVLSFYVGI